MKMQLADFPRWLRALFAVFLISFFFNALYALVAFTALITTWSWRVDPGVATLVGAIVGLCIVAWQARLGFTNLIRSQEHRAAIEMEARQHQHKLDTDQEEQRIEGERRVLMAALRAEIVGLWDQAQSTKGYLIIMRELAEQMAAANASNSTKSIKLPTFNAPVYQANVSKIGLLGASLGADVVRLMTRTGIVPPAEFDPPPSYEMIAKLYDGLADGMQEWQADLVHVAMRIRAREEGSPDPGTLWEAEEKRQQEKSKKENAAE